MSTIQRPSLFGVYLRGIAMGAADVVPGVSGGTIAFITGIYELLLASIKSVNFTALRILRQQGFRACWQAVNGTFLLVLLLGIITSIVSLARLISYCLEHYPLLIWAFFFGLIVASIVHMLRQIKHWDAPSVIVLVIGALAAFAITELKPTELSPDWSTFLFAGAIAICAMILPGISGSFLLVLMGMYSHVLVSLKEFHWLNLACFAAGCGVGLLSFSHLLSWLFRRFHDQTVALLTGFLLGSLNLVWPWKHTLSYYQGSKGDLRPLEQQNVWPWDYFSLTQVDPQLMGCLILLFGGIFLVLILERVGQKSLVSSKAS